MNDGRKDALLANRLNGLLELLGRDKVLAVLHQHGTGRFCKRIDNVQLLWVIVGFGLFANKSYRELFRLIAECGRALPTRAAICAARKRLPAAVLACLYEELVGLLATPRSCPTAFYKGLRLMGIDGTLLDCYDSEVNRHFFQRPSNQSGSGAFPKLRLVTLAELGTRLLWRSVIGTYRDCERTLAGQLLQHLTSKQLLLADRHFGVAPIIYRLINGNIPFLIRAKKSHIFPVETQLADQSFLSRIYINKNDRVCKRPGKTIRVIRYTLEDPARPGHREDHVLLTNLMSSKKHPAKELVCLYHERWQEEIAFGELKQRLHQGRVLRSQSPEMVRQEVWGLLFAHFVIRTLVYQAAKRRGVAPSRISCTATINILQLNLREAPRGQRASKRLRRGWLRQMLDDIRLEIMPLRKPRTNPRVIKKRSVARKTKHDYHRKPPPPNPCFASVIRISI